MRRSPPVRKASNGTAFSVALVITALALGGTGYLLWVHKTSQALHQRIATADQSAAKHEEPASPKKMATPLEFVKGTVAAHPVAVFSKT